MMCLPKWLNFLFIKNKQLKNLFLLIVLQFSISSIGQSGKEACLTLSKMNQIIKEFHYSPKPINDSLSVYLFNNFLNSLDSNNDLFLKSEIEYLKKYQYKIDNYILSNECAFLNDFFNTYNQAVTRREKIIESIKKETFPSSSTEQIRFYSKKLPYLTTEAELNKIFKKRMLLDVFYDISKISAKKDSLIKVFATLFPNSKQKVFDDFTCQNLKLHLTREDFNDRFFSIYSNYFDPHTQFFSKNAKSDFLSTVSADNYTFGLFLTRDENQKILVSGTLPGTSVYFLEKIEAGDEIIKIKYANDEYAVNCSNQEKLESIISSSEYKKAYFTFRKKSGEIYGLTLVKQIMKDYHNSTFSYILERDQQKTGYINIPSFYSTLEDGKTNVSEDVAKEIHKFKEDNITGLIIDLEDNGGGSMLEAMKLCSLFIKGLPIGQTMDKNHQREGISAENNKVIYTGPIIIIQNGNSASASEFFTNVMQDYRLALVVGTKSYGKASVQEIIPLDTTENQFLKVTIGKFYRISGQSNQFQGIQPDIEIPDFFDGQIQRERNSKTAFKNDIVQSMVNTSSFPFNEKQKAAITKYTTKYKTDTEIQKIKKMRANLDHITNDPMPPLLLNFSTVYDRIIKIGLNWETLVNEGKKEYNFNIFNTTYDVKSLKLEDYLKTVNEERIKMLKNNYRIYEAISIMTDLK